MENSENFVMDYKAFRPKFKSVTEAKNWVIHAYEAMVSLGVYKFGNFSGVAWLFSGLLMQNHAVFIEIWFQTWQYIQYLNSEIVEGAV